MKNTTPAIGFTAIALCLVVGLFFIVRGIIVHFGFNGISDENVKLTFIGDANPKFAIRDQRENENPELTPAETLTEKMGTGQLGSLLAEFLTEFTSNKESIPGQMVLRFKDENAYRRFLESAKQNGFDLIGKLDPFLSAKIGFKDLNDLKRTLGSSADDLSEIGPTYAVTIPDLPPETDSRGPGAQPTGFGNGLLEFLGITGDNSSFGTGVNVAILDSGIAPHITFEGLDIKKFDLVSPGTQDVTPDTVGHGTAVSSLIAGRHPEAAGVAPGSSLSNYRVTGPDGVSDTFTLAQGIIDATDGGANIINISLGSTANAPLLEQAVNYAFERGTLIVASSGNETFTDAVFPARYENVISVGAIDANGQQTQFSNASPTLEFSAPGYAINAAAPQDPETGGERIFRFTGTSASAPVVAGQIAAVMSEFQINDPFQAVEILRTTANDAGAPGHDPDFGFGIPNTQRALQSQVRGIIDVATTSVYYDELGDFGFGPNQALVVVQNQGTEPVFNVPLNVVQDGRSRSHTFNRLAPNEVGVFPIPVNIRQLENEGTLSFTSTVSSADSVSDNNRLQSTIFFQLPPAEG